MSNFQYPNPEADHTPNLSSPTQSNFGGTDSDPIPDPIESNSVNRTVFTKAFALTREDIETIADLRRQSNLISDSAALRILISQWKNEHLKTAENAPQSDSLF